MPRKLQGFHTAYPDMVSNPNGHPHSDLVACRVCGMWIAMSEPKDIRAHDAEHEALSHGGAPLVVREILKTVGWNLAHQDRPLDLVRYTSDDGKLPDYGCSLRQFSCCLGPLAYRAFVL